MDTDLLTYSTHLICYYSNRSNAKMYSIALLNAETVLHDHWGNVEYWRARRSMRFNSYLIQIATDFRATNFDSTDVKDRTEYPTDWRDEMVIT